MNVKLQGISYYYTHQAQLNLYEQKKNQTKTPKKYMLLL